MIRELRIKNLALIEELVLEFNSGFSVFTGETGAGKSILIGAIGLLLGERASTDLIRSGFEEAEVSGVFEITRISKPLADLLEEFGIEPEENQLIIRRKITRNDRNRIHVNQIPLPLGSLKKLGDFLIDFHGQHDHQSLLSEENHLHIIDNLPGIADELQAYHEAYQKWHQSDSTLQEHTRRSRMLSEKRDVLEFQLKEISCLDLHTGEELDLEKELSLLSTTAERSACVSDILGYLDTSNESIIKRISSIRKRLETLSKYDQSIEQWITDIENTLSIFSELEIFCSSYLEKTEETANPTRIEHINSRLAKIQRLKKKYNCTSDELILKMKSLQSDLAAIENSESDREFLLKQVQTALIACKEAGSALSQARKKAAAEFDKHITVYMEQLGFKGGLWRSTFTSVDTPLPSGFDTCVFMVRTNPGESMLPLAKTASGGEISRLMLAIKSVLAEHDHIPVLIFDEIDTGVGGILAGEVGKAMYKLSHTHQVLCISHLHQIASMADNHFLVQKEVIGKRTVTVVKPLSQNEKVEEIARMLGGNSEIALKHARELLKPKLLS